MLPIVGNERSADLKCDTCDLQVEIPQSRTGAFQFGFHQSKAARGTFVEWQQVHRCQQYVHPRKVFGRAFGLGSTVYQLPHANRRDCQSLYWGHSLF